MKNKTMNKERMVSAVRAIRAAGVSVIAANIFLENIMPEDRHSELSKTTGEAFLVSYLANKRYRSDWFVLTLLRRVGEYYYKEPEVAREFTQSLLLDAGFSKDLLKSVNEAGSSKPSMECTELALAMRYAETLTAEDGSYMTWEKCCESKTDKSGCEECMMLKYALRHRNLKEQYDGLLMQIRTIEKEKLYDTRPDEEELLRQNAAKTARAERADTASVGGAK